MLQHSVPTTAILAEESAVPTTAQQERRRALVRPREHGAWGMLLVPLVIGAAVGLRTGGSFALVMLLTTAVLALFWLRTPTESWLGVGAVRAQSPEERRHAIKFVLPLAAIATGSLVAVFWRGGNRELVVLALIAGVAFAAQVFLKRRGQSTRMIAEIAGALVLTSTAPAAYCVATGRLDTTAWSLWLLNWMFAANQVHYVWLRIRGARVFRGAEKFRVGWSFVASQVLLLTVLVLALDQRWVPPLALVAFVPILFRGSIWFVQRPESIVVRRLGWTEMANALVFGVLLIAGYTFRH